MLLVTVVVRFVLIVVGQIIAAVAAAGEAKAVVWLFFGCLVREVVGRILRIEV